MSSSTSTAQAKRPKQREASRNKLVEHAKSGVTKNALTKVRFYDKNGESTVNKRASAKSEYLCFVRAAASADGKLDDDVTEEQLSEYAFSLGEFLSTACEYLAAVAHSQEDVPTGMNGNRIKIGVLRERANALTWWVTRYHGELAHNYVPHWQEQFGALCHKLAMQHGLGIEHRPKTYLGLMELRLLFIRLAQKGNDIRAKQHYLAWLMAAVTGARPASLGTSGRRKNIKLVDAPCLRWKNIEFIPNLDGRFAVFITLEWVKANRDPHKRKPGMTGQVVFLVRSCRDPKNLHADITWVLFLVAYERGLFGNDVTWQSLWHSNLAKLPHDAIVTRRPVFLAGNHKKPDIPASALSFNPPLQDACRDVGLLVPVTMYCFRREMLSMVRNSTNTELTKELATHQIRDNDALKHYLRGNGDLDIGQIRLGEYDDVTDGTMTRTEQIGANRNKISEWLMPAIRNLDDTGDYRARERDFVKEAIKDKQERIDQAAARLANEYQKRYSLETRQTKTRPQSEDRRTFTSVRNSLGKLLDADKSDWMFNVKDILDTEAWLQEARQAETTTEAFDWMHAIEAAHVILVKSETRVLRKEYLKQCQESSTPLLQTEIEKRKTVSQRPVDDPGDEGRQAATSSQSRVAGLTTVPADIGDDDERDEDERSPAVTSSRSTGVLRDGLGGTGNSEEESGDEEDEGGDPIREMLKVHPNLQLDVTQPDDMPPGLDVQTIDERKEALMADWLIWSKPNPKSGSKKQKRGGGGTKTPRAKATRGTRTQTPDVGVELDNDVETNSETETEIQTDTESESESEDETDVVETRSIRPKRAAAVQARSKVDQSYRNPFGEREVAKGNQGNASEDEASSSTEHDPTTVKRQCKGLSHLL